jgi:hypothetical protein
MGLDKIADRLDAALHEADDHLVQQEQAILESDARRMAHYIMRHMLESAPVGTDPYEMGKALVQGATLGEDESGGELVDPVISFLEDVLEGAKSVVQERFGADNIVYDPVQHCVQYYLSHNRWPESATPGCIAKAKAALAAGQRGQGGANNAAFGTFY